MYYSKPETPIQPHNVCDYSPQHSEGCADHNTKLSIHDNCTISPTVQQCHVDHATFELSTWEIVEAGKTPMYGSGLMQETSPRSYQADLYPPELSTLNLEDVLQITSIYAELLVPQASPQPCNSPAYPYEKAALKRGSSPGICAYFNNSMPQAAFQDNKVDDFFSEPTSWKAKDITGAVSMFNNCTKPQASRQPLQRAGVGPEQNLNRYDDIQTSPDASTVHVLSAPSYQPVDTPILALGELTSWKREDRPVTMFNNCTTPQAAFQSNHMDRYFSEPISRKGETGKVSMFNNCTMPQASHQPLHKAGLSPEQNLNKNDEIRMSPDCSDVDVLSLPNYEPVDNTPLLPSGEPTSWKGEAETACMFNNCRMPQASCQTIQQAGVGLEQNLNDEVQMSPDSSEIHVHSVPSYSRVNDTLLLPSGEPTSWNGEAGTVSIFNNPMPPNIFLANQGDRYFSEPTTWTGTTGTVSIFNNTMPQAAHQLFHQAGVNPEQIQKKNDEVQMSPDTTTVHLLSVPRYPPLNTPLLASGEPSSRKEEAGTRTVSMFDDHSMPQVPFQPTHVDSYFSDLTSWKWETGTVSMFNNFTMPQASHQPLQGGVGPEQNQKKNDVQMSTDATTVHLSPPWYPPVNYTHLLTCGEPTTWKGEAGNGTVSIFNNCTMPQASPQLLQQAGVGPEQNLNKNDESRTSPDTNAVHVLSVPSYPPVNGTPLLASGGAPQMHFRKAGFQTTSLMYPSPSETTNTDRSMSSNPASQCAYTKEQLGILENAFKKCRFPRWKKIWRLAAASKIPEQQIKIWFQNERKKRPKYRVPLILPRKPQQILLPSMARTIGQQRTPSLSLTPQMSGAPAFHHLHVQSPPLIYNAVTPIYLLQYNPYGGNVIYLR